MVKLTAQMALLTADLTTMIFKSQAGSQFLWGLFLFWIVSAAILAKQFAACLFFTLPPTDEGMTQL